MALLVDAGPLYALIDAGDRNHRRCRELLESHPGPLLVPTLVVTEVAHLVGSRLTARAEVRFLEDLASGALMVEPVHAGDWIRIAELVWRYQNLSLGTVDASVVASAERLRVPVIATLDRRHFGVVKPAHVERFEIVP